MKEPNTIGHDEAEVARATARDGLYGEFVYPSRLWMPIEYTEASGRAKCRLCGELIAKGVKCISFMFDPHGGMDRFGRTHKAYLHIDCEGGTDADVAS